MSLRKRQPWQLSLDEHFRADSSLLPREYGREDTQLKGAIDRITLARAIRKLPVGCRTIFVLHDVEGYGHHEIAGLLHCSVGNSKSQLHRARLKLRELLEVRGRFGRRAPEGAAIAAIMQECPLARSGAYTRRRLQPGTRAPFLSPLGRAFWRSRSPPQSLRPNQMWCSLPIECCFLQERNEEDRVGDQTIKECKSLCHGGWLLSPPKAIEECDASGPTHV
jgi:hypothetical protein